MEFYRIPVLEMHPSLLRRRWRRKSGQENNWDAVTDVEREKTGGTRAFLVDYLFLCMVWMR